MLDFQVLQAPFRFGLAEGVDPHQVPPGTLTTAENVVWRQSGRLEKRLGIASLSSTVIGGATLAACKRLFTRGSELCLIDSTHLYSYSSTLASWKDVGPVPDIGVTVSTLADMSTGIAVFDSALTAAGLRVDAWTSSPSTSTDSALFVRIVDASTGSVLMAPQQIVAASSVCIGARVIVIGTTAIILTHTGAATVTGVSVNTSTLAVGATSSLRTDGSAFMTSFDACVIGSNFVIGYTDNTTAIKLFSYNSSMVQQATGGITGEVNGAKRISLAGTASGVLYVAYVQGTVVPGLVRIAIADPATLVQTVAPVTVETPSGATVPDQIGVCVYDATNCVMAYRIVDGSNTCVASYKVTSAAVVNASSRRATFGCELISRPFMFNSRCWMVVAERSYATASNPTDRSTVLLEIESFAYATTASPHKYVGCIDVLIGGSSTGGYGGSETPTSIVLMSATSATMAVPFQSSGMTGTVFRQGFRLVTFTAGASLPTDMWRSVAVSSEAFLACGVLTSYDGVAAFDYSFPRAPAFYSVTPAAGGNMAAGTYLYGMTLEYRSNTGLLYRSQTQTVGGTAVSGALGKVTLVVEGYNLGNKQNERTGFGTLISAKTLLALYRTTVGGTTYQRLTVDPSYSTTFADQSTGSLTPPDDTRADSNIGGNLALASRPAIYTTGGILDDYAPPGCVTMFRHVDRLWVLAGDQKTWWYSKAFQDDLGVAPGFHPNFRISFDDVQTAGASMDDKAVFFSATTVRYMQGLGPAANGQNSDFSTPIGIQSDVGCTNARSVVSTPDGIMFLSARGLYLLTRGLELVWIGRAVKDTLASYPTITSATLVASRNQVRFTCNDVAGTSGVVLVFDYVEKQWSTFRYTAGGTYGTAIADACMYNGAWTFATPSGTVYQESATSYLDGSSWVPMTIETAWISAAGPISFNSMRRMFLHGTSYTNHDLTVAVGFDSETTYVTTSTFAAQSAVTAVGVEECSVMIGQRRKCQTIRFRVKDYTPTTGAVSTGRGPAFDMMGVEVGVKRGFQATGSTKKG